MIINNERSITIKKISHHQMMIGDNHLMRINAKLWLENTYDDYGKANGWQIADDCEDLESTYQNNVNDVEIKPLTQEAFEIPALSKETVDLWTNLKGTRKGNVEIKHPTFDIHKPLSKEDNAFIEESNNKTMEIRKQIMQLSDDQFEQLKESLKKDCEHVFIKMDNGAAMGPYDQAIGDLCKLCGKWENVKTLQQVMKEVKNV